MVTVLEIRGKRVRLGIEASREMCVHRLEVIVDIAEPTLRPAEVGPVDGETDLPLTPGHRSKL